MSAYEEQSEAVRDLFRYGLALTLLLSNRNEDLDPELLSGLLGALEACRLEWDGRDEIPRVAVSLLVELPAVLMGQAEIREEPARTAVTDAAMAVWEKVNAAVQVAGEPPDDWRSP